ncbi:hypothetical protein QJS10_CPA08g01846 [Acorus calamus]|uniref:Uncharacterized protein n=1 Tax=Acorus calamus TaxID=4465 RepID=A0AAV9EAB9_ACOCL|nr:hypothetical protein QJS10_CPA08g01846 [Acorus calamus]
MKPTLLLLPLLLSLSFSSAANDPVLDQSGHKLRRGVEYYILPAITDVGGGVTTYLRNGTCPFEVALDVSGVSDGRALTISPADSKKDTVRLLTDAYFQFTGATICITSDKWTLVDETSTGGRRIITAGGEGSPFKIDKMGSFDDVYKLVFCPTVCDTCRPICQDVGVVFEEGKRWLVLSDQPSLLCSRGLEI